MAENVTYQPARQDNTNVQQAADETDQSPPPPYSECLQSEGTGPCADDTNQQWKFENGTSGYSYPPPPPFDAINVAPSSIGRPLLPLPQPIRVVVDQRGVPVSVPPGIQVVVVPARNSRTVLSRDEESRRVRSIALPLAILSLFFGSMFCAIPALVCACRRHAPAIDYRKSIALSTIALLIGITGLVFAAIRANRNAMAYM